MWYGCPGIQLKFRSKWGEAEGRTQGTLDVVHLAYRQSGVVMRKESWTRRGEEEDESSLGACCCSEPCPASDGEAKGRVGWVGPGLSRETSGSLEAKQGWEPCKGRGRGGQGPDRGFVGGQGEECGLKAVTLPTPAPAPQTSHPLLA